MCRNTICTLVLALLSLPFAAAGSIESAGQVSLNGELSHPSELSGAALHNNLLVVCPDEGVTLNVLRRTSDDRFDALPGIRLLDDDQAEIDMEGVAGDGRSVYVVGSHSNARKKLEADKQYETNRKRLLEIKDEASRQHVFRIRLDDDGRCARRDSISLGKIIKNDGILAPFARLPGKENGIDIEGIAASDGKLFVGFRGPVLRDNYVPVMALAFDKPEDYELLFVDLGGRGIRDLAAVADGLLVLAGPVGDGDGSCELYFWNKKDCLPGRESPGGTITHLGTIVSTDKSKSEGLAVLKEADGDVELLLIRDGMSDRGAERLRIALPR